MRLRRRFSSALLIKIAKHLALVACLMIVSEASGRFAIGEFGIFLLVSIAVLIHALGQMLQRDLYV